MKPDLTLLYSELGLKPNCSLAELQLAYRRRISELQPNRLPGGLQSAESGVALRNLIALYTTATRFHRRFGRLPGAPPHRLGARHAAPASRPRIYADYSDPLSGERSSSSSRLAFWLAVVLLVLLFTLLALASGEWLR